MWDTGSDCCQITHSVIKQLRLIPTGNTYDISTVIGGGKSYEYRLTLTIPNLPSFEELSVIEMRDNTDYDMIIGMDVIDRGTFILKNDGKGGVAEFSYSVIVDE